MAVIYRKRQSLFDKGEDEWRVEDGALVWRRPDGRESRFPWSEAQDVRASYAPTKMKSWRHVFVIAFSQGAPITIDNVHFRGVGDFEDRSASYSEFVRAAVAEVARHAPGAKGHVGEAPWTYYLELTFALGTMAALAVLLLLLPLPSYGYIALRLILIAAMLPVFYRWIVRARPRGVPLDPAAFVQGLPKSA